MKNNELQILVTEDDDGHADLIVEGLREIGLCNPIERFRDGQEAWDFFQENQGKEILNRCLLLLDINMPRMDGVELLGLLKKNDELHHIPVIMLTTTDDPREVSKCYELGCNVYVSKPVDFIKFAETLKRLGLFLQVVQVN